MSDYILKRNLFRPDGSIVGIGQPVPDDIDDEALEQMLAKGTITTRKKRAYTKPAPKSDEITGE